MNSKSPVDSAIKCFLFFLISQPLIYLIQVPFSSQGWHIFVYYKLFLIGLDKNYGCTIIIVTHNEELAQLSDRKIVLQDGRVM